jgi:WhiB family redox-sensing transcriptional regulator
MTTTLTRRATRPAAQNTDWMADGLCRQFDPDLFFPDGRGAAVAIQNAQAKEVCMGCPVRAVCLEWAIDTGQSAGVWGGMSEDERAPLRRDLMTKRSGVTRCVQSQAYIEKRLGEDGASERQVSEELGVWPSTLRRALAMFEAEREQNTEVAA